MMLKNALENIKNRQGISFHMPGHKNGRYLKQQFPTHWLEMDITEITDADNLMDPKECILESQQRAEKIYHAENTKFLVNGSTSGIEAMILGATKPKDRVLVNRNAHQSVFNALLLADVEVIFLPMNMENGVITSIKEDLFNKEIVNCDAVVFTYPTYEGVCMDIGKYIEIAHQHDVPVLVDAAHGAHITFSKYFPDCPVLLGADVVVMSLHKTLPAMTQTALIHYSTKRIDEDKLNHFIKTFQSSSPSYILMASIDYAMEYCEHEQASFDQWFELVQKYRSKIEKIGCFSVFTPRISSYDYTKILLMTNAHGYTGYEIANLLEENERIYVEYANSESCLLMTSPLTTEEDLIRLVSGLRGIPAKKALSDDTLNLLPSINGMCMGLREAFYSNKRLVLLDEAIGKICAANIIAYPPGIPILVPGEKITNEHRSFIKENMKNVGKIIGLSENGHIKVIE